MKKGFTLIDPGRSSSPRRRGPDDIANQSKTKDGFTLIELLVVIAIIAILAVVVVLTLNPGELLKQSRDSNRLSDLGTLKTAISFYLQDNRMPNLASSTAGYTGCYLSTSAGNGTSTSKCGVFAGGGITTNVSTTSALYRKVDATGWVPVNLSSVSFGTPLGALPIDPLNSANYYYAYAASSSNNMFELNAWIESTKYGKNGGGDVVSKDGGDASSTYETGTNINL